MQGTPPRQVVERDPLTDRIIGAAIDVHRALGPGLLESAYEACLAFELRDRGLRVAQQVELPVVYRGMTLDCGYRIDLLVDDAVVVELKCVRSFEPVHEAQLLTYLRLSGKRVGLLLNFHANYLKNGMLRRVL
jgi:GxxExxY protein